MYRALGPLFAAIFILGDLGAQIYEHAQHGRPDTPKEWIFLLLGIAAAVYAVYDLRERLEKLKDPLRYARFMLALYCVFQGTTQMATMFFFYRIWWPLAILPFVFWPDWFPQKLQDDIDNEHTRKRNERYEVAARTKQLETADNTLPAPLDKSSSVDRDR